MKKLFLFLIALGFTSSGFTQTNRYTNLSTSSYKARSAEEIMSSYDARGASANVIKNAIYYYEKIEALLEKNTDYQFKSDLRTAKSYLNPIIIEQRPMSIASAEWYVKKCRKTMNKAIRKYNKRVKKANKN